MNYRWELMIRLSCVEAIDVVQVDSCRLAGVSEVLSVLLMAAKFGVPVCPHAGGVGLCEVRIHRYKILVAMC